LLSCLLIRFVILIVILNEPFGLCRFPVVRDSSNNLRSVFLTLDKADGLTTTPIFFQTFSLYYVNFFKKSFFFTKQRSILACRSPTSLWPSNTEVLPRFAIP